MIKDYQDYIRDNTELKRTIANMRNSAMHAPDYVQTVSAMPSKPSSTVYAPTAYPPQSWCGTTMHIPPGISTYTNTSPSVVNVSIVTNTIPQDESVMTGLQQPSDHSVIQLDTSQVSPPYISI